MCVLCIRFTHQDGTDFVTVSSKAAGVGVVERNTEEHIKYAAHPGRGSLQNSLLTKSDIPDESRRKEMREFARSEFERHKNITDIVGRPLYIHLSLSADPVIDPYPVSDLRWKITIRHDKNQLDQCRYPAMRYCPFYKVITCS